MLHQIIHNDNRPHDLHERVKCPKCAEWIRFEAKLCPQCKSSDDEWKRGMISAIKAKEAEMVQERDSLVKVVRIIVIIIVLILLIIFFPSCFRLEPSAQ